MNVQLINYTQEAAEILCFTKNTRLTMTPDLLDEIRAWPHEKKMAELDYMAGTIPSSWEMVSYIFLVTGVSRAYTHQQVRSRVASFAQQSMRVLDMGEFDYVWADSITDSIPAQRAVENLLKQIKRTYRFLTENGIPPEDARGILPTNIATNIVCKFNLRSFVELAKSRMGGRTQKEYQRVITSMVDQVLAIHPWAEKFLFGSVNRDYFEEIEAFALQEFPDLAKRGKLLKIVDQMRKAV